MIMDKMRAKVPESDAQFKPKVLSVLTGATFLYVAGNAIRLSAFLIGQPPRRSI